jgi:hypothetical protein
MSKDGAFKTEPAQALICFIKDGAQALRPYGEIGMPRVMSKDGAFKTEPAQR